MRVVDKGVRGKLPGALTIKADKLYPSRLIYSRKFVTAAGFSAVLEALTLPPARCFTGYYLCTGQIKEKLVFQYLGTC
jgi:hypothetical protein